MQFHPRDLSELDELTEEHLGFSALSNGLGFSRGNKSEAKGPATEGETDDDPLLRKKALAGTGAVAAGPALPAWAAPSPGLSSATRSPHATPTRTPLHPSISATPASPNATPAAAKAAAVLGEPAAPRALRLACFLGDALIVFLPLLAAWVFSFRGGSWKLFAAAPRPPLLLFGLVFAAYFLLSESFGGQSLGKMLLGLRVVEDDKYEKPTGLRHAAVRLVLLVLGAAMLGLGFLASFRDPKRRPWHDRYSGSIVRRRA